MASPAIADADLPRAADLAQRLVDGVLAEATGNTTRVGVILNGLGATKYEELFVVWRSVAPMLRDAGYTLVDPEVGELVTSLDMAGCSLTLVFLDDELETLWRAPADTPAYRKGVAAQGVRRPPHRGARSRAATTVAATSTVVSPAGRRCGQTATAILAAVAAAIDGAADELGRIDAVAGDGDHGRGMVKGTTAALGAATTADEAGAGAETVLIKAGDAWASQAGGTSGVLWGAALAAVGRRLGDDRDEVTGADIAAAVRDGLDAITALGKANLGDKTMVDAWAPFADRLDGEIAAGTPLAAAWAEAAATAEAAAQATAELKPKVGRARPLAERSLGTPDAGALSFALCVRTAAAVLADTDDTAGSKR